MRRSISNGLYCHQQTHVSLYLLIPIVWDSTICFGCRPMHCMWYHRTNCRYTSAVAGVCNWFNGKHSLGEWVRCAWLPNKSIHFMTAIFGSVINRPAMRRMAIRNFVNFLKVERKHELLPLLLLHGEQWNQTTETLCRRRKKNPSKSDSIECEHLMKFIVVVALSSTALTTRHSWEAQAAASNHKNELFALKWKNSNMEK